MKKIVSGLTAVTLAISAFSGMTSFAAVANKYTPTMTENFDRQTSSFEFSTPNLTPSYVLKTGSDYWWNVRFPKNDNGLYGRTADIITSTENEYYLEFDFSTDVCDNFSIAPVDSSNTATNISLSMSRHGYMIGTSNKPTTLGVNGDKTVIENSRAMAEENKDGWMKCSDTKDYEAGKIYNVRYVFNKTTNKIDLYLNDVWLRDVTVTDVTEYKRLMIFAHYSGSNNANKNFRLDNVEVGTVSQVTVPGATVNVSSANIFENGVLTIVFDAAVDASTLTTQNIKVTKNDAPVSYTNAQYNSDTKTWTATITGFSVFEDYKVKVENVAGTDNNSVATFEKTLNGTKYLFTPALNDTFDNASPKSDWKPSWSPDVEYVEETGRGKVAAIKYATKAATTPTDIKFAIDEYLSRAGAVKYVSFDVKTPALRNLAFTLTNADVSYYPASFIIAEKGWAMGKHVQPSNAATSELVKNYFENSKQTLEGWGVNSFGDYKAGDWHNVKFILDSINEKVYVLLNGKAIYSYDATAAQQANITRLLVVNCSAETDKTVNVMYIDNFQVGTARTNASDVLLVNASNEQLLNNQNVSVAYSSAVIRNTSDKEMEAQVSCAAYGSSGELIDIKIKSVRVGAGETVIVNAEDCEGLNTAGASVIKAFVWSGWDSLTPLAPNDAVTISVGETESN